MSANMSPIFPKLPKTGVATWPDNDANEKDVFTAGENGAVIQNLSFAQAGAMATTVNIFLRKSTTNYRIGRYVSPATANFTANLLTPEVIPSLNDQDPVLNLGPGDILRVSTSDNDSVRDVVAIGGDY